MGREKRVPSHTGNEGRINGAHFSEAANLMNLYWLVVHLLNARLSAPPKVCGAYRVMSLIVLFRIHNVELKNLPQLARLDE